MQGKGLNLHKLYKEIKKSCYETELTKNVVDDYAKKLENAKDAGRLSALQIEKYEDHLDELQENVGKKFEKKALSNLKINKKVVVLVGSVVIFTAAIAGISSCSKNKNNKGQNQEVTTEYDTENDLNNDVKEEPTIDNVVDNKIPEGFNFKADNIETIKSNVSMLIEQMSKSGFEITDKTAMTEKFINFYIVKNINKFSYKTLAELDQEGYLNYYTMYQDYIEVETLMAKYMTMATDNSLDAKVHTQKTKDSELLNEIGALAVKLNNATTMEEKISAVNEIITFKSNFINNISTNNLDYDAQTIHMALTTILYLDESAKSKTGVAVISPSEDLLGIFNSGECANVTIIENEDEYLATLNITSTTASNGYKNTQNTNFSNTLEDSLYRALIYSTAVSANSEVSNAFKVENSYDNIVDEVSESLIIDNENVQDYTVWLNKERAIYNEYLDSLREVETIAPTDKVIEDDKGNTVIVEKEELDKTGSDTVEDYEENKKEQIKEELDDKTTITDSKGEEIATGDAADEYIEDNLEYKEDENVYFDALYSEGSSIGAQDGYTDGFINLDSKYSAGTYTDVNIDGKVDSYDKGYIDSYCENYKIGNDNYKSYEEYETETETSLEQDPEFIPLPTVYPDPEFIPLPTIVDDDMYHITENENTSYDSIFIPVDGEIIEEEIVEEEIHSKTR